MSKEIRYYNNINPQTAYISGIVEAFISDLIFVEYEGYVLMLIIGSSE